MFIDVCILVGKLVLLVQLDICSKTLFVKLMAVRPWFCREKRMIERQSDVIDKHFITQIELIPYFTNSP